MLKNHKAKIERLAADARRHRQLVEDYGAFLMSLFCPGDWFVTITFRDRLQDERRIARKREETVTHTHAGRPKPVKCEADPRLENWEPQSKYRPAPTPPVRDAALREIEHFQLELGWASAGRTRQELFDRLAEGLDRHERREFARRICRKCVICEILEEPTLFTFYLEIHEVATKTIGWAIAEEFGRAGGRWHVHLLVRGVQHLRRKKWWRRAFIRFGRSRIEPVHE